MPWGARKNCNNKKKTEPIMRKDKDNTIQTFKFRFITENNVIWGKIIYIPCNLTRVNSCQRKRITLLIVNGSTKLVWHLITNSKFSCRLPRPEFIPYSKTTSDVDSVIIYLLTMFHSYSIDLKIFIVIWVKHCQKADYRRGPYRN